MAQTRSKRCPSADPKDPGHTISILLRWLYFIKYCLSTFKISVKFLFCRRYHHIALLWIVSRGRVKRRRKGWRWTRLFIKTPEGGREASSRYFELMRSFHGGTSHFMEPLSELVTPQLLPQNMLRVVTGRARRRIFRKIQELGSENQGKAESYSEAAEGLYCSLEVIEVASVIN